MDYSDFNARKNGSYSKIWTNTGKCVFCDLREKYIITTNERAVLTVNIFPYINGHLLIVPKRHVEDFLEITNEEWADMHELAQIGVTLLRNVLNIEEVWIIQRAPHGFKAAKTVAHAHMLLMPYEKELINWNFQEITLPPMELAKELRKKL